MCFFICLLSLSLSSIAILIFFLSLQFWLLKLILNLPNHEAYSASIQCLLCYEPSIFKKTNKTEPTISLNLISGFSNKEKLNTIQSAILQTNFE